MDLGKLVLKESSFEDYEFWKKKWCGKRVKFDDYALYASIESPLIYISYLDAIDDFFSCDFAQSLSIFDNQAREGSKWKRLFKKEIKKPNFKRKMRLFANIAQNQPQDRKRRAFFEMKFGDINARHSEDMLVIGYTELDNKYIISTCIDFPHNFSHLFNIPDNPKIHQYSRIESAWMPK